MSDRGNACSSNHAVDASNWKAYVKSSLKKPSTIRSTIPVEGDHAHDSMEEAQNSIVSCTERRKVHWTDSCGGELVHIREFEPSNDDISDDEFERGCKRRCECVIQ